MSNPYSNFNQDGSGPFQHWPRTSSEEQTYGTLAAVALKSLGVPELDKIINTAEVHEGRYTATGLPLAVESESSGIGGLGIFSTVRTGLEAVERFKPGPIRSWDSGTKLPFHYAQLAAAYRRNQNGFQYDSVLSKFSSNLVGVSTAEPTAVYLLMEAALSSFIDNPANSPQTPRMYPLMAALQVDSPPPAPPEQIDGQNGLTARASNPGTDTWRAPGYTFNYVIDVTDVTDPSAGNPFVVAAARLDDRLVPGETDQIVLPAVNGPGATPTIAVLLPARSIAARTTVTTKQGATSSGQIAAFDLQSRRVNLHFIAPWSNSNTTVLTESWSDARDDLNSTYKLVMDAGGNGGANSAQLGFRFANQGAYLDVHLWCTEVRSAATQAIFVGPDTSVGNEQGLGNLEVTLNLCKITDKKPAATVPPCIDGILVEYARLNTNGVYLDLPYSQGNSINLKNARKGRMDLNYVRTERSGGAALRAVRDLSAKDNSTPPWGIGQIRLLEWHCPQSWSSRLTINASPVVLAAGIYQDVILDACEIVESNITAGRSTDTWATADHLNASAIGAAFSFTPPVLGLKNELSGVDLGAPNSNGHYTENFKLEDCVLFSAAPYEPTRIDSLTLGSFRTTEMFMDDVTASITGPNTETVPQKKLYLGTNSSGDLPAIPSSGLLAGFVISNPVAPGGGQSSPELWGGGDPNNGAVNPEAILDGGSTLTFEDSITFYNFRGPAWSPETGDPSFETFTASLLTRNSYQQNKAITTEPLITSRKPLAQREAELGPWFSEDIRNTGGGGIRAIERGYSRIQIDYYFSGATPYIADGADAPYYELSSPAYVINSNNFTLIIDPNIPQSADWDDVAKTGYGPQYIRVMRNLSPSSSRVGGRAHYAFPPNSLRNADPTLADKYEVAGLGGPNTVLCASEAGRCVKFAGQQGTEAFEGVGPNYEGALSTLYNAAYPSSVSYIKDITIEPEPILGNPRCKFTTVFGQNTVYFYDTGSGGTPTVFTTPKPGNETYSQQSRPSRLLQSGYPELPGKLVLDNVRYQGRSLAGVAEPGNITWRAYNTGDVTVQDCDFANNGIFHFLYISTSGEVIIRNSTFQRARSQAIQFVHRTYPQTASDNGVYNKLKVSEPRHVVSFTRPTRDVTLNNSDGQWLPTVPNDEVFTDVEMFDWAGNRKVRFDITITPIDSTYVDVRPSKIIENSHIVDAERGGSLRGFAISNLIQASSRFPGKFRMTNCSIIMAHTEHVYPLTQPPPYRGGGEPPANIDMLDSTSLATYGFAESTPYYLANSNTRYRSDGALTTTSCWEMLRCVRSEDLSAQTTDEAKAEWLTANLTAAEPYISTKFVERYARASAQAGSSYILIDDGNFYQSNIQCYQAPSFPIGTEGYQDVIPWKQTRVNNEWMVRDSSTNNMWFFDNTLIRYESDGSGGYKHIDRWVNLGPVTGNNHTSHILDNVLLDISDCQKDDFVKIATVDHITFTNCGIVSRASDDASNNYERLYDSFGTISIVIDGEGQPSPLDGMGDSKANASRRVTLQNLDIRPNNVPRADFEFYDNQSYLTAVAGTEFEVRPNDTSGNPTGPIRVDNLTMPIKFELKSICSRSEFTPSGPGYAGARHGGYPGGSEESTAILSAIFGMQLTGRDLRAVTIEFILVPGALVNGKPDYSESRVANSTFTTAWASAGYPLPELRTDVQFPDGENHEYMWYPEVFQDYLNNPQDHPISSWTWVAIYNGNMYEEGTPLESALPAYPGWQDPDTFN